LHEEGGTREKEEVARLKEAHTGVKKNRRDFQ